MREIPENLARHAAGETTTLCRCWRVTRRDAEVMGFTDHDRDLSFGGTLFEAAGGLDATEAASHAGLAVGGGEVMGALGSAGLTEPDLSAGLWDEAEVEVFTVNWRAPEERLRMGVFTIGEVRRTGGAFTAELRALTHRLDQRRGRLYAATCDARFGDRRCGMDTGDPAFRGSGEAILVAGRFSFTASGLGGFAPGWFTGGVLTWESGANSGESVELRDHRAASGGVELALWQGTAREIAPGDRFGIVAGCDKRMETCRDRFANIGNFRGFPHMPGTDRALAYPSASDPEMDGGSLFR